MWSKIKARSSEIFGAIILFLSAWLFYSRRKNDSLESELSQAKNEAKTSEVDRAREIAKKEAADLLAEYERSRRDWDSKR